MFLELPERVAIVTGAARGIGFAIAERLSRAGARVVVADVDEEGAVAAVGRLRERGAEAVEVVADITKPEEVGAMVECAIDGFGKLDVLVNNAGITGRDAALSKITDEDWERVLKLNLTATFYCCRAAIARMREQRSGAVVNVASISGKEGNPNMIPYSVSKAGMPSPICARRKSPIWGMRSGTPGYYNLVHRQAGHAVILPFPSRERPGFSPPRVLMTVQHNPFVYGRPISREDEKRSMRGGAVSGQALMLHAPRRYGRPLPSFGLSSTA